jgi:hypothetical protein
MMTDLSSVGSISDTEHAPRNEHMKAANVAPPTTCHGIVIRRAKCKVATLVPKKLANLLVPKRSGIGAVGKTFKSEGS